MFKDCLIEACQFEKIASTPTLVFELLIIALTLMTLGYLYKQKSRYLLKRFGLIALGILIFELFTQPLWNNHFMSPWAYLYIDISWVLTLVWTLIIFFASLVSEYRIRPALEYQRFLYTLGIGAVAGFILEAIVLALGIRSYAPEVQEMMSGTTLPLLNIPIEALYYIPVFMMLVISFVRYWELTITKFSLKPSGKVVHPVSIAAAFVGVLLFEIMNDPAVINTGWPEWSYFYHDLSIIRIALFVLLLAISAEFTQTMFKYESPYFRFMIAVIFLTIITVPVEAYLVKLGFRQYSESLLSGFSGYTFPYTQLPIEVCFAVPLYVALIIPFVRYWTSNWESTHQS